MTHSSTQGSATSAWSFIQSARQDGTCERSPRCSSRVVVQHRKTRAHDTWIQRNVDIVDVLGALAVGERGVEDHDDSAVNDEAHLASKGVVQPLRVIGEDLREHLARERNVFSDLELWEEPIGSTDTGTCTKKTTGARIAVAVHTGTDWGKV